MKIKEGFELRSVCGEHLIMASGRENIDFSKVIWLNESAKVMFDAVKGKTFTVQDMADALLNEYEVDAATALADAEKILGEWKQIGFVSED